MFLEKKSDEKTNDKREYLCNQIMHTDVLSKYIQEKKIGQCANCSSDTIGKQFFVGEVRDHVISCMRQLNYSYSTRNIRDVSADE